MLRFYALHAFAPCACAALALVVFETTDLDRALGDLFYDPATRAFPLHKHWFFKTVLHDWAKFALFGFAACVLAGLVLSRWRPALRPWRRAMVYVLLCMAAGPLLVAYLKHTSYRHCPRDLQIYGGYAPYTKLLDPPVPGVPPGKCFPGGHASGGFALMSIYFALRGRHPKAARRALWLGFGYGFVLGVGRMAQGAHFLSHNLCTAFLCWCVCLVLYLLLWRRQKTNSASSPGNKPAQANN